MSQYGLRRTFFKAYLKRHTEKTYSKRNISKRHIKKIYRKGMSQKDILKRHIRKGISPKEMSRHFFFQATLRFQPSKCALRLEMSYFRVSAMAETLLLPFFVRPPWRKRSFSHFLLFSRGGNDIFAVFYSSAMAESRFSAFSHFHPWMTDGFLCFSRFVGRR